MTFTIPQLWSVLVLDDSEDRISWFRQRLRNVSSPKTSAAVISFFSQRPRVAYSRSWNKGLNGHMPDNQSQSV